MLEAFSDEFCTWNTDPRAESGWKLDQVGSATQRTALATPRAAHRCVAKGSRLMVPPRLSLSLSAQPDQDQVMAPCARLKSSIQRVARECQDVLFLALVRENLWRPAPQQSLPPQHSIRTIALALTTGRRLTIRRLPANESDVPF